MRIVGGCGLSASLPRGPAELRSADRREPTCVSNGNAWGLCARAVILMNRLTCPVTMQSLSRGIGDSIGVERRLALCPAGFLNPPGERNRYWPWNGPPTPVPFSQGQNHECRHAPRRTRLDLHFRLVARRSNSRRRPLGEGGQSIRSPRSWSRSYSIKASVTACMSPEMI